MVSRSALVARARAAHSNVIIVTAAAGYGKSTVIAEIVADDPRPTAWVSLTSAENDPAALLSYIAVALDDIEPVDPASIAPLWGAAATIGSAAVQRFVGMFASRNRPFTLVLDDVHELVSQDVLDILAALVRELPPGSTLLLGSRRFVPLPWGRVRARRRLVEIGPGDLAFDDDEAALLFERLGVAVTPAERARLLERTEGWPVAVYLAALAYGNGHAPVAERVGDHRYLVEYLGEELLDELDPEVASFLLDASCFERMSGVLCDEVLGRSGSALLLEDLRRHNQLVIPLDGHREWYRFHHLMAEFLQADLRRRDPGRRVAIHRQASRWCNDQGDADGAVGHAVRCGDLDLAEATVMRWLNPVATVPTGGARTLRWVSLFPADELAVRPQMLAAAVIASFTTGDMKSATQWMEQLAAALPEHHPDHPDSLAPLWLALQRALISPSSPHEMLAEATYVYEHMDLRTWHPTPCLLLGAAAYMLGDEVEAVRRLTEGVETHLDRPTTIGTCLAHLAIIDAEHGRWAEARTRAQRARDLIGDTVQRLEFALVLAAHVLVETRAGRADDVETDRLRARSHLTGLVDVAPWLNLQTRLALARAALIRGDRAETRALLDEADSILAATPDAVHVAEQISTLRLELGQRHRSQSFGPKSLTTAELRVLHLLPTHLTMPEVAERLYVSRNTVRTQATSIYRKLGVSSRSDAVKAAGAAGLLNLAIGRP